MTQTVQVRIALMVDDEGRWIAQGISDDPDDDYARECLREWAETEGPVLNPGRAIYWITATVPVPEERDIEGQCVKDA